MTHNNLNYPDQWVPEKGEALATAKQNTAEFQISLSAHSLQPFASTKLQYLQPLPLSPSSCDQFLSHALKHMASRRHRIHTSFPEKIQFKIINHWFIK